MDAYPRDRHEDIERAIAEGWMWLVREGLIALKPGDAYGIWYFVSRKGKTLRNQAGVAVYRQAAAFPRQLSLTSSTWRQGIT